MSIPYPDSLMSCPSHIASGGESFLAPIFLTSVNQLLPYRSSPIWSRHVRGGLDPWLFELRDAHNVIERSPDRTWHIHNAEAFVGEMYLIR